MNKRLQRAEIRWSDRERRLLVRSKFSDIELAWAAGHFEGEGTVTLTRGGRIMHVRPQVSLSSTDKSVQKFFHDRWPGSIRSFLPRSWSGNVRIAHTWVLGSGERIQGFLMDILPFIRTERVRQKIVVVLDDIRDRGLYQQQPDTRDRSRQRLALMRQLNAKGRDTVTVEGDIRVMLPIRPGIEQQYSTGRFTPLLGGPTP